jgi:hypothetical protein
MSARSRWAEGAGEWGSCAGALDTEKEEDNGRLTQAEVLAALPKAGEARSARAKAPRQIDLGLPGTGRR